MTRKLLPLLVVFIAVSAGLLWVKWKRDHPVPTAFDLEVRQLFVRDEYAEIDLGEENYRLSSQERKEIASHLFLIPADKTSGKEANSVANWYQERIILDPERRNDFYRTDSSDLKIDNIIRISIGFILRRVVFSGNGFLTIPKSRKI